MGTVQRRCGMALTLTEDGVTHPLWPLVVILAEIATRMEQTGLLEAPLDAVVVDGEDSEVA